MPNLFRDDSSDPKANAQRNLCGRTHYVDDDTLRFHKSRVLSAHVVDQGLLFAIVTSDGKSMDGGGRVYRYVVFDLFGFVVERAQLSEGYPSTKAATKAMWAFLNALDAKAVTLAAIERETRQHAAVMDWTRAKIVELTADRAA